MEHFEHERVKVIMVTNINTDMEQESREVNAEDGL